MHQSTKIILTREELYQRVWRTPAVRLAKEIGISDVAIGKRCRRQNIPRPGRGYWTLLAMGKPMPIPELPPLARREGVGKRVEQPRDPASPPRPMTDTGNVDHRPAREPSRIEFSTAGGPLHPIAERVKNSLLLLKTGDNGLVHLRQRGLPRITASSAHALQIARIFHALIHAADEKQLSIRAEDDPCAPGVVLGRGEATAGLSLEQIRGGKPKYKGSAASQKEASDMFQFCLNLRWNQADLTSPPAKVVGAILRTMELFITERELSQMR